MSHLKRSCTLNQEENGDQGSEDNYLSSYDESGQDSDYLPQRDKYEYSDSGQESQNEKKAGSSIKSNEKPGKRKDHAGPIKQKKWKLRRFVKIRSKKGKKTNITENMHTRDQRESQLDFTKTKRAREARLRQLELKLHQTKLNNLVKSNDFEIVKVAADGNCLLEATLLQTGNGESVDEFRCTICSHIERNKQYKKTFTTVTDEYFDKGLEELRGHDHWNNMLGDIMPLAIYFRLCQAMIHQDKNFFIHC